jgi:DNA-directed RNA polymerase I, II, and III subunit RPABC2
MSEIKGYEETKQNLLWEELNLPLLNLSFDVLNYDYNKHNIPEDNKEWVKNQKNYFENYDNEMTKEAIMLITMKSMKLFNYVIDKNADLSSMSESVQELINKFGNKKLRILTNDIIKYTLNAPLTNNNITIYSGINRKYYEKIKNDESFISSRFMSGSFNKEHANYYAFVGSRGRYAKTNNLPYTVYNITIPKNFNKVFYFEFENQIVFLPNIKFKKIKENLIEQENVIEISGKRLVKENVLIENIYYTIDDTYEHVYQYQIDEKIEYLQEDLDELDEKIEDLQEETDELEESDEEESDEKKESDIGTDSDEEEDEEEETDSDDSDYEDYLQKLDKDVISNFIKEKHPESINHNYEEVKIMTNVNRNEDGEITNDKIHKTLPFLTKYEKARILGLRAKQINQGAHPFVEVPDNVIDGYTIAIMELQQKKIPFIIRRPIPNGGSEYWKVSDLELLD